MQISELLAIVVVACASSLFEGKHGSQWLSPSCYQRFLENPLHCSAAAVAGMPFSVRDRFRIDLGTGILDNVKRSMDRSNCVLSNNNLMFFE